MIANLHCTCSVTTGTSQVHQLLSSCLAILQQGQSAEIGKPNIRVVRLALSDYSSSYDELLQKTKFTTVHIHSIRQLALEISKTLHNSNPVLMKDYFV